MDCEYRNAIVSSNVQSIEEARIVSILQRHGSSMPYYKMYSEFNERIIRTFYRKGDVILVEDDWTKPKADLIKRVKYLAPEDFFVEGWDDHDAGICKEIREIQEIRSKIEALSIKNRGVRDPLCKATNEVFVLNCKLQLKEREKNFVINTFDQRQESLCKRTLHHLNHSSGRIIELCGRLHGITDNNDNPMFSVAAQKYCTLLSSYPYMILDPLKNVEILCKVS